MKKLLIIVLSIIVSCSDNSDNISTTPYIDPTLENSQLSPASVNVTGVKKTINFELKTNGVVLKNSDFSWTISNSDIGHLDNQGKFYSTMIGNALITVKDNKNNSINANIIVNPMVTDIPDVPYIRWDSSANEIISNVPGWNLVSTTNSVLEFRNGNWSLKYFFGNTGLWQVLLSSSESQFNNSDKFMSYNLERFKLVQSSDPNDASWARWYFLNPKDNKNVYIDINKTSNSYYYLRYKNN
ncbi:uncharacterized protein CHSO_1103 [Chryseobacterium sp. StRB126]|uniref:hypothetical protein n=1 Tax=Chryseobacterium sp. StRB126 TaxID=878220 RepID=UPI0004E98421|nr:hypothetical protein [Chryseobacterium sp. StRB126]BAP30140.1 uncharacterized protein CHSO_1103 [Chryseobacterium sp. StRB126]